MSDPKTAQPQQKPSSAPGFEQFTGMFTGLLDEQYRRMESMIQEVASMETKGAEQIRSAIDESAKLMKQTLDYSLKLSSEWRRLAVESTRRYADWAQPKG